MVPQKDFKGFYSIDGKVELDSDFKSYNLS